MKKIIVFVVSIFLLNSMAYAEQNASTTTGEEWSEPVKTLDGRTLNVILGEKGMIFKEYRGKILFLELWGTDCPPCVISIPYYVELQEKYKDDLAMVAVEVQTASKEELKKFVASKKINYDIIHQADGKLILDYIKQKAGWTGAIPLLLVFDQKGEAQLVHPGLASKGMLEIMIKNMINENNASK